MVVGNIYLVGNQGSRNVGVNEGEKRGDLEFVHNVEQVGGLIGGKPTAVIPF